MSSHYWHVAYEIHYGVVPPRAYVIEHLGHVDEIPIPNHAGICRNPS